MNTIKLNPAYWTLQEQHSNSTTLWFYHLYPFWRHRAVTHARVSWAFFRDRILCTTVCTRFCWRYRERPDITSAFLVVSFSGVSQPVSNGDTSGKKSIPAKCWAHLYGRDVLLSSNVKASPARSLAVCMSFRKHYLKTAFSLIFWCFVRLLRGMKNWSVCVCTYIYITQHSMSTTDLYLVRKLKASVIGEQVAQDVILRPFIWSFNPNTYNIQLQ